MGKIYLVFSKSFNPKILTNDDIIISPFEFISINLSNQIKVNPNDIDLNNYRDELETLRELFLINLSNKISKEAFTSSFSNFYNHIFRSIFKWIVVIDQIRIKYPKKKIIITELVAYNNYLPYYEAEGEINKELFYKSFDFIPHYIKGFLDKNKIEHSVIENKSRMMLGLRIFARRYLLLNLKLVLALKSKLSFKNKSQKLDFKDINSDETCSIILSRGVPHTHFFFPYMSANANSLIFVSDGIKSHNKNLKLFQDLKIRGVSNLSYLSIFDHFNIFLKIIISLFKTLHVPSKTVFKNVTFNFKSCLREMIIAFFEVKLYEKSLNSFLYQLKASGFNKIVLFSGEMFTPYAAVVASSARKFQFKSIQLQTCAVDYWPMVKFVFCDKFIFSSYQALKFYETNNPNEAHKYDFWGSLINLKKLKVSSNLNKVLYFSQPYENENELQIVQYLVNILNLHDVKLYIKLHPRDSKTKFKSVKGSLNFINSDLIDTYIADFQLTVVRTSSIAQEVIIRGTPTLVILLTKLDQTISIDYIQNRYKIFSCFVSNLNELDKSIVNFDNTVNDFIKFREIFLKENRLNNELSSFQSKIIELECQK